MSEILPFSTVIRSIVPLLIWETDVVLYSCSQFTDQSHDPAVTFLQVTLENYSQDAEALAGLETMLGTNALA